jgi:thymidylate kinase
MRYIVVEGLPAVGKSETLELLARFYPETVRVFPELVKEIVTRERLDLFKDRSRLTEAIAEELPRRKTAISDALKERKLCIEESHLGVHAAYAHALEDRSFLAVYPRLEHLLPSPDGYIRLEIPVVVSLARQAARGDSRFSVDRLILERMLTQLDRWHEERGTSLSFIDANRPAHLVLKDAEDAMRLSYGAPPEAFGETFEVLLLLGRPASGKSEFIDFLGSCLVEERARSLHIAPYRVIDDFPLLWEKFEEDDLWERLGRRRLFSKRCNGNYAVADDGIWSFLIEKINRYGTPVVTSPHAGERQTLIIEFARGGATGYADALARLSPRIVERAAILYVSVSFEESWRRNIARYDERKRAGILTHSVPREEMERTYGTDDWDTLAGEELGTLEINGRRIPYACLLNEPESTDPVVLGNRYRRTLGPLYALWRTGSA